MNKKVKKDKVRERWFLHQEEAINLVKRMADEKLKDFEEPSRTGVARGDPIGLSRKKYRAAILMILFPNSLYLKEVAKLAEVSNGVLRVWQTKNDFKEAILNECKYLGSIIAKKIEDNRDLIHKTDLNGTTGAWSSLSDIISMLPHFNIEVLKPVLASLKSHLDRDDTGYAAIGLLLHKKVNVINEKDLKDWERSSHMIDINKAAITSYFNEISDPEYRNKFSPEEIKNQASGMENFILSLIDEMVE
jgi:hypothetical protein